MRVARLTRLQHLARRFFGSLRSAGASPADEAWVVARLAPAEVQLWRRMSPADRAHAAGVARRVAAALPAAEPAALAAAALHDVGKVEAGLGTFGRTVATVAAAVAGRERVIARRGRFARYLTHDQIGARLLAEAGSDPLVVTWAAEHHRSPEHWTLDPAVGAVLKDADDD